MRRGTKLILLLSIGFGFITFVYIVSFHRIGNIRDAAKVISVARLPDKGDDRCKIFNATHYICLPNVFLIGASKCGTTSVMDYLLHHDKVTYVRRRISPVDRHKEVHRFDRKSYAWSSNIIELADEWASSPVVPSTDFAVIHYTPHYIYAPTVPFEMRKFYSHSERLKFIVLLRDPIERALSSYWFQNSHLFHKEDRGSIREFEDLARAEMIQRREFDKCMDRQIDLTKSAAIGTALGFSTVSFGMEYRSVNSTSASCKGSCRSGFSTTTQHFHALKQCFGAHFRSPQLGTRHLDKGIYYDQLLRWWDNFPASNFYITSLERWKKNATREYQDMLSFIFNDEYQHDWRSTDSSEQYISADNYEDYYREEMFQHKRLVKPNNRSLDKNQQLSIEFRRTLKEFYRPYNDKLWPILDTAVLGFPT
jgi:Sulfotransferase domain